VLSPGPACTAFRNPDGVYLPVHEMLGLAGTVHEFHPGIQSELTSMTLFVCKTAPLVSILRICSHLTTLKYFGVIRDFNRSKWKRLALRWVMRRHSNT
jgi:hypothetical protein